MLRKSQLSLAVGAALGLTSMTFMPANAQDLSANQLEEVIVTGSRITRANLVSSSPVTQIDAEDMMFQGTTRVEDLVKELPQVYSQQNSTQQNGATGTATLNLRNLGDERTLVLINGRRLPAGSPVQGGVGADINQIPGALIERVQGDTIAVQNIWSVVITGLGRDAIALITLFGVAMSIDLRWTLFALIGAPLLILPTMAVQRYIRRKTDHLRTQAAARATRLDEVFHGIAAVKLNRMEDYQLSRFGHIVASIVHGEVKSAASRALIPALIDIVTGLGFLGVLVMAGPQITEGDRTVGEFMAFFTAMALAFQPLRRLGDMAGIWQVAATSLTRIFRLQGERDRLPVEQRSQVKDLVLRAESTAYSLRTRFHDLLQREMKTRIDSLNWFLDDVMGDPKRARGEYPYEIRNRQRIDAIAAELGDDLSPALKSELHRVDERIRLIVRPADFVWDEGLAPIFPRERFWYLYTSP